MTAIFFDREEAAMVTALADKTGQVRVNGHSYDNAPPNWVFWSGLAFGVADCWLWVKSRDTGGYGVIGSQKAHRRAWALFNGPIPAGMSVLHKCDVRNCCNPEHLFLGTQLDNMQDAKAKGRLIPPRPQPGDLNPQAKLTPELVREMKAAKALYGSSYKAIGRKFGVSAMTAYRAITGESWKETL